MDYNPGIQELEAFTRNKTSKISLYFQNYFLQSYLSDIFADTSFLGSKICSGEKEIVLLNFLTVKYYWQCNSHINWQNLHTYIYSLTKQ